MFANRHTTNTHDTIDTRKWSTIYVRLNWQLNRYHHTKYKLCSACERARLASGSKGPLHWLGGESCSLSCNRDRWTSTRIVLALATRHVMWVGADRVNYTAIRLARFVGGSCLIFRVQYEQQHLCVSDRFVGHSSRQVIRICSHSNTPQMYCAARRCTPYVHTTMDCVRLREL